MRVIVKEPEEQYGRFEEIDGSLGTLQSIVDGYIETMQLSDDLVIVCNEDGRLLNLPTNVQINDVELVGTIIVCRVGDEDFEDVDLSFDEWMDIVDSGEVE